MKREATALVFVVLLAASSVPAAAVSSSDTAQSGSAYAGTHVAFDVQQDAVVDYRVDGTTVVDSVKVQSGSSGNAGGVFDGSVALSALTNIEGAPVSLSASANAEASVGVEGSASMTAHDDEHGILVVEAGGRDQAVLANVSADAEASSESSQQVEVTTEDGTETTFIVVGDGSVTVNDAGDVSAKLNGDAHLVVRSYPDGKSERADRTEELIADGKATAEVYVEQQDGELVTDTVSYSQQMSVEAEQSAEDTVTVTADRAKSEGRIVVTSVSEAAVGSVSDLDVTVDGEAAAQASSYSELRGAIGSDTSTYVVKQSGSASATADVYVAVNHFSQRKIQMSGASDDGGDTTDGDSGSTGGSSPGFGVGVALVAVLGAALAADRR